MYNSVFLGNQAEQWAQLYLERQGLRFITNNYRITGGEIDLIMIDQAYYVFIEVKMRKNLNYGDTLEIISPSKKSRIIRTAKHFLLSNKLVEQVDCRFDVIGITENGAHIDWIQNAFEVQY